MTSADTPWGKHFMYTVHAGLDVESSNASSGVIGTFGAKATCVGGMECWLFTSERLVAWFVNVTSGIVGNIECVTGKVVCIGDVESLSSVISE